MQIRCRNALAAICERSAVCAPPQVPGRVRVARGKGRVSQRARSRSAVDGFEADEGCSPAAAPESARSEAFDARILFQVMFHRSAQGSDAFSMNDPNLLDTLLEAGLKVSVEKSTHFLRTEGVQVERAVNRPINRFIRHGRHAFE